MPVKAKPIDPERARLAARGVWGREQRQTKTSSVSHRVTDVGRTRRGSCASSSTTSSGSSSSSCARRGRWRRGATDNKGHERSGGSTVARVFALTNQENDCSSGASNSDPELYRAARERTARFLYPNGHCVAKKNMNIENVNKTSNDNGSFVEKEDSVEKLASDSKKDFVSAAVTPKKAEANMSPTPQEGQKHVEFREYMSSDADDDVSTRFHRQLPVVQEALQGLQGTADSEIKNEFDRLMDLLALDIQNERLGVRQMSEDDPARKRISKASNDDGSCDGGTFTDAHGQGLQAEVSKPYFPPSHTFAELQECALLQLYAASQAKESEKCFIASDHMAEAFTLAAMEAADNRLQGAGVAVPSARSAASAAMHLAESGNNNNNGGGESVPQPSGAPLTLLEIVFAERARLNAQAALRGRLDENGDVLPVDDSANLSLCTDANLLAANAEASLDRFILAVRCIESAISDKRVTDDLGAFLFKHHKLFLEARCSSETIDNAPREFLHEAFTVYEKYSTYVSTFITQLLNKHVPKFNMEEFVLALYDVSHYGNPDDAAVGDYAVMDVLSYSAWRLLQSISSFDQFVVFMDEFIAEEYGVEQETQRKNKEGDEGADANVSGDVVVVAGARGIRALLKKNKAKAIDVTTLVSGEGPSQESLLTFSNTDGGNKNNISKTDNENISDDSYVLYFGDTAADKAPSLAPGERREGESHATVESCPHAKSPLAAKVNLRATIPSLESSALPMPTPTLPHPSGLEFLRCSSHNNNTANFFLHPTKGARRPEAVPGRNLPPLPDVTGGERRDGTVLTTPSESTVALGSDDSFQALVGSGTFPIGKGVGAEKIEGKRRNMGTSTSALSLSSLNSKVNCGKRIKSSSDRTNGTVTSEKPSITRSRKKHTK